MKIKKLLIGLLVSGLALSFTGCGDNGTITKDGTITKEGNKYHIFGQFVEIKKIRFRDPMCNMLIDEFFLYDTETKIVYVLLNGDVDSGITPYYVLDENGKPEIAIYGENYSG